MDGKRLTGLIFVLMIYLAVGSALFRFIEKDQQAKILGLFNVTLQEFISSHNCVSTKELANLVVELKDIAGPFLESTRLASNSTYYEVWTYAAAFTFSVTVVTTIGYGNIYTTTPIGRLLTVLYALIGIPITLLTLGGLGEQLSKLTNRVSHLSLRPGAPTQNKVLNMVILVVAGLAVLFLIPSIVFMKVERWDILTAVYYCFTTLTTIGFGDYVAASQPQLIGDENSWAIYQVCVYLWILVGLAFLSLTIKSISKMFISKAEQVEKKALKRVNLKQLSTRADLRRSKRGHDNELFNKKIPKETLQLDEQKNVTLVKVSTVDTDRY